MNMFRSQTVSELYPRLSHQVTVWDNNMVPGSVCVCDNHDWRVYVWRVCLLTHDVWI